MTEISRPRPAEGGFANGVATAAALQEVTEISRWRSAAHTDANLFRDLQVNAVDSGQHELRRELSAARSVLARWALLLAHPETRTIDIARVENNGEWDATDEAEGEIRELGEYLAESAQIEQMVSRDTPEAKLRITIDPNTISARGLVVVRRKRLLLATHSTRVNFVDIRESKQWVNGAWRQAETRRRTADMHMEVDKVSEFLLDVEALREVSDKAATAVAAIAENQLTLEVTGHGLPHVPAAIETAINERHGAMMPVVTAYYGERKYRHVRDAESVEPAMLEAV